jgi:hypothetical protein
MVERRETTIFQETLVRITNLRIIIGTTSYSVAEIQSATLTKRARDVRPLWLVPLGALLILWAILDETRQFSELLNIGLVLVMLGPTLVVMAKPTYAVQLGCLWGNVCILISTNPAFVQKFVAAINRVLAGKIK